MKGGGSANVCDITRLFVHGPQGGTRSAAQEGPSARMREARVQVSGENFARAAERFGGGGGGSIGPGGGGGGGGVGGGGTTAGRGGGGGAGAQWEAERLSVSMLEGSISARQAAEEEFGGTIVEIQRPVTMWQAKETGWNNRVSIDCT